ncbi:MAG: trypsin-like peptidase domain-containing protein, partial [Nocardioides sp.]|nr:trypsin-like peptidase domain-containing protein [Nocardioides sp.]
MSDEQSNQPEEPFDPKSGVEDTHRFGDDELGESQPSYAPGQRFAPPGPGQTPIGQTPIGQTPVGQTPVGQTPREPAPQESVPGTPGPPVYPTPAPYAGYASTGPGQPPPPGVPTGHGSGPAPYGQAFGQPQTQAPVKRRTSRGIWPAVAALALVVGLIGGALGGVVVDQVSDSSDEPGRTSGGLDDVDVASEAPLPAENGSVAAVAKKLLPSTVQIIAELDGQEGGATGSGFFMDKQGHVVTNNHVIEAAAKDNGKIEIVDQSGNRYDASVVGRSAIYDLAVLYVKDVAKAQPAALGASKRLLVGESVVALGSPLGLSSTVTSGIVSAKDRPVTTGGDSQSYINAVQTDAAINPGNSGGPLVNLKGEVVGVNSAIATTGGAMGGESGNIGVGFAIPIEQVRVTADQILKDGEAHYPVIGASVNSNGTGDGAHIQGIEDDSPAEAGGLEE